MKKIFINELTEGMGFESIFVLAKKTSLQTKNGDPYLAVTLADKTGDMKGNAWSFLGCTDAWATIQEHSVVLVSGTVQSYKGSLQASITSIAPYTDTYSMTDFLATIDADIHELTRELHTKIASISNPFLQKLLNSFFEDEAMMHKFCEAPAAKKVHDNKMGGLLKHTLQLVRLIEATLPLYAQLQLNRDLIITGALLHDIGKTEELQWASGSIDYSEKGRLVGHINLAIIWTSERIDTIKDFPESLKNNLLHLIISHHGQLDFGSNILPATKEAFFLHQVDLMDSALISVDQLTEQQTGWQWNNHWNRWIFLPEKT